ncbi:MAG: CBS domain-containing protein, partial [Cyanobacteriota/Melainabacteria group bacterium]
DKESFQMARRMAREEGLLVGGSCGTAMSAALRVAEGLTEEDVMVVLLPDGGRGYLSKFYSDDWMKSLGFMPAEAQVYYLRDLIERKSGRGKYPAMITVSPDEPVRKAIELMEKHQIDQLPVVDHNGRNVGHVNDVVAMQVVYERKNPTDIRVGDVMGRPFPQLDMTAELDQLYKLFRLGNAMVVVMEDDKACGVLTRFDIMWHLRETIHSVPEKAEKKTKAGV